MIIELLSAIGPQLNAGLQQKLFLKLYERAMNDSQIACQLAFQVVGARFLPPPVAIQAGQSPTEAVRVGPFLYDGLDRDRDAPKDCPLRVGVGCPVTVEVDISNPFGVALPLILLVSDVGQCRNDEAMVMLAPKAVSKARIALVPLRAENFELAGLDAVIYQGHQDLKLPRPLSVTVFPNITQFAVRTDMPLEQALRLFDGESFAFTAWISNTGLLDIERCELKYLKTTVSHQDLPIRPSETASIRGVVPVDTTLREIALTAVCGAADSDVRSVITLQQPVTVEPSITITAVEPLVSLIEIANYGSELIFLAVDITNHSGATFTYTASFDMSADALCSFPGVLNREPRTAFLAPYETTVFILAIAKADLLASANAVPVKRVMAAVKLEEEKLKHKVDKARRAILVERLGVTTFLESHLTFEWRIGNGRRGTLTTENSALPTPETLVELRLHRPRARHSFVGFDGATVRCEQRTRLRVA
jgi:hypothetical protein